MINSRGLGVSCKRVKEHTDGNTVHCFIAVSLRRTAVSLIEVPYVLDDDARISTSVYFFLLGFESERKKEGRFGIIRCGRGQNWRAVHQSKSNHLDDLEQQSRNRNATPKVGVK